MNRYRFSDNGTERELQIPIEQFWDVNGREDAIEVYEEEVVEQVINPTEDFEVTRFDHESYRVVSTEPKRPQMISESSANYEFAISLAGLLFSLGLTLIAFTTPNSKGRQGRIF